jgi:hypothetical protein
VALLPLRSLPPSAWDGVGYPHHPSMRRTDAARSSIACSTVVTARLQGAQSHLFGRGGTHYGGLSHAINDYLL